MSKKKKESTASVTDWSAGETITLIYDAFGIKTYAEKNILKVDKKGVWLDNGPGNDPDGPFDPATGIWDEYAYLGLGYQKIVKYKESK